MNDLEQQLAKVIEKSLEVAERTGEFVIDQAPELLQEFYLWHMVKYSLGILLGVVLLGAGAYGIKRCLESSWWGEPEVVFPISGSIVVIIFGLVTTIGDIYNLAFIMVAPKLYLIEYFLK